MCFVRTLSGLAMGARLRLLPLQGDHGARAFNDSPLVDDGDGLIHSMFYIYTYIDTYHTFYIVCNMSYIICYVS